ncbi:MAG: sugar transferase [Synechococcus sp.]
MVAVENHSQYNQHVAAKQPVHGGASTLAARRLTQLELVNILLEAELIDRDQLSSAMDLQQSSNGLTIGDAFVEQQILSRETVDFFIHQFPILKASPSSANLGLILRSAGLMTAYQESEVLRFQRMNPSFRFGEIAVLFGYCKQKTLDLLLVNLFSAARIVSRVPHSSIESKAKRAIDIAGALVGLSITALIFIPLSIAIRMDSSGPVLYSQIRLGLRGKPFRIWKFRSMIQGADVKQHLLQSETKGQFFKLKEDTRITRVGKFIRKTSLDEFPQFWNVLLGDMSLVGTRPPTPSEAMEYEDWHWRRLNVKPGITGEWQVNGRSSITDFDDVVKLDIRYQKRWSIQHDLRIILQTISAIVTRKGAC